MSNESDDTKVGYARPPNDAKWKKGRSGNLRKIYTRKPKSDADVIDKLFMSNIKSKTNDGAHKLPAIGVIMMQLWTHMTAGKRQAQRTFDNYQEYFRRVSEPVVETVFEDHQPDSTLTASMIDKEVDHD